MGLMDKIRNGIQSWLRIQPATNTVINIVESTDYETNAIKNKIWYRGDSEEIEQLYKQLNGSKTRFWSAVSTQGMEIRKIHVGVPAMIVDILTDIVINDINDVEIDDENIKNLWNGIEKENNFKKLLKKACKETLYIGDGAFKINFCPEISDKPLIEFVSGDKIDYIVKCGRITDIIFKTVYKKSGKEYVLQEKYGKNYIRYKLLQDNKEVSLDLLDETQGLSDVTWKSDFAMAVPLHIFESSKFENRGESIFDKKIDAFDSLDECWSQWMDALRANRTREYIPENMLPRNPQNGEILQPNAFDNRYIKIDDSMQENARNEITLQQGNIPHDSYLTTYITALDLCLQGLISPSTLGIDTKKLDNAEATREKEKATLYTRDSIIRALEETLPRVVENSIRAYAEMYNVNISNDKIASVTFGEYANPSFESQIETIGKAKTQGIMSIEACIDELYGDTKEDEWKQEEVARLRAEQGIVELEEFKITDEED
jgi:hypothetical protein